MAIHYFDPRGFSRGQGYTGPYCRTTSAQATAARFLAVDCFPCKLILVDKRVSSADDIGRVIEVYSDRVVIARSGGDLISVNFRDFDNDWEAA